MRARDRKLLYPKDGAPLDAAGMPVTSEPVEGGVAMINASLPVDHDAHLVYREPSSDEKRIAKKTAKAWAAFSRADGRVFLRMQRDALLAATDFVQFGARVKGKSAWLKWRKELFDLPDTVEDPEDVDWPEPPFIISQLLPHRTLWPDLDWDLDG